MNHTPNKSKSDIGSQKYGLNQVMLNLVEDTCLGVMRNMQPTHCSKKTTQVLFKATGTGGIVTSKGAIPQELPLIPEKPPVIS